MVIPRLLLVLALGGLAGAAAAADPATATLPEATATELPADALTLAVDARELPGGLLHVHETLATAGGDAVLVFPKWIPGTHAPAGRIVNLVGLRFSAGGATLAWDRDEADPYRFIVHAPGGGARLEADFTYIANHGDVSSAGVDVDGARGLGVINWNCCVLCPEGRPVAAVPVATSLLLPAGWKPGTALAVLRARAPAWRFATTTVATLVDRPLIAGPGLTETALDAGALPLALVIASADGVPVVADQEWCDHLAAAAIQAQRLCGPAHCRSYRWLFMIGDSFDDIGLEHGDCSLCGLAGRPFSDYDSTSYGDRDLPVHELLHSWCGKHVRPAAMATGDLQAPQRTGLLWVYEGLTMYLGEVVGARAGLHTPEEFRAQLASDIHDLSFQRGRAWRSVEDTARAAWMLREPSGRYADLRRGEEFYTEGKLFWLEADLIIRAQSGGARSLDDFCRAFLGAPLAPGTTLRTYTLDDVVAALTAVQQYDWRALVRARISAVRPRLDGSGYESGGWRLVYTAPPAAEAPAPSVDENARLDARASLGFELVGGRVAGLQPDSPAARAGLHEGDQVAAVNGRRLDGSALETALELAARDGLGKVHLMVGVDRVLVDVHWDGGPRHPRLERIADAPDLLGAILAPRGP
jgi:predicted metalloprotease with PDZ domain